MALSLSNISIRKPSALHIGTAGIPLSTNPRNMLGAIPRLRELHLDAMEIEFVRNITLNQSTASKILEQNKDQDVMLTCHGSYFINLNAAENNTIIASRRRILEGATMARMAGAWSMTFHAAYYLKDEKSLVYDRVKEQLKHTVLELKNAGNNIWIRPETTGKESQFGNIREIISLSQDVEQVMPCIDFAHLHARTNGKYNTIAEFREILDIVEKGLGREGLNNMHIHMSGINYGPKGEKNHLFLEESDFNWKDLMQVWKEYKIKGAVINESPNIEKDAILMKKYWEGLK